MGGAYLTGMDSTDTTRTTTQAGTLTVTVWPDSPLGEHQRYAYRIEDATSGQALQGRDLFTGIGAPIDPGTALRELASYLTAAGEARQHTIDHPDAAPGHEGMFPSWLAEAARENSGAVAGLTVPPDPASAHSGQRRWVSVVFLQGEEADDVLAVVDRDGPDAAIAHLAGWDYGEETTDAAMVNGYVYDTPPTGALDHTASTGAYVLTYNHSLGHVGLLRELTTPPDPALDEPHRPHVTAARTSRPASRAADGAAWFTSPPRAAASGRGPSL